MAMRKFIPALLLVLIVVASGCLFKPPAEVKFSVDRTVVRPGGTIHVMILVNNTGKVGLTGATLVLGDDTFQILQEPKFPKVLPVGESVQLVWILRAPPKQGVYNLKLSLELTDELKRSWTGFYGQFRITVSDTISSSEEIPVSVEAPDTVSGGDVYRLTLRIENPMNGQISLSDIQLDLLDGMEVLGSDAVPETVEPGQTVTIGYLIKAPYTKREGYVSVIVKYRIGRVERSAVESVPMKVVWRPWEASSNDLDGAYGPEYYWVVKNRIVDSYWESFYNSTSEFDRKELGNFTRGIIDGAESEVEAARAILNWMDRHYSFSSNTSTLEPGEILLKDRASYSEAQILFTAMMRSINVPAMMITLYDGTSCMKHPITGFYTADGWYIVDIRHGFLGSMDEYLASPYFPKVHQLVNDGGYRLVAQNPSLLTGHEHVDVTEYFMASLEDRLLATILQRLKPELRSKFMIAINDLQGDERLYALFLMSAAPSQDDLNRVVGEYSISQIEQNVKTMYDFYKNMKWADDFTRYWKIFAGEE
ncbi:transglutaminase domain-containing protein [Thermococcus sp. M36]|uniref:transglutaminase-like domain-containing protein n=1 Tax=Thermococcus sp. M36 TaxID=1638261 RepID=UPI00143B4A42|nr:transglutaminase-like domain-containing protein [Thermococcus sp. M36]NJE04967.1 transglutaminase domain-containing protein [Thermococcus sp. M36]